MTEDSQIIIKLAPGLSMDIERLLPGGRILTLKLRASAACSDVGNGSGLEAQPDHGAIAGPDGEHQVGVVGVPEGKPLAGGQNEDCLVHGVKADAKDRTSSGNIVFIFRN